ncbi:MAG: hypothetical protein IPJ06_16210 [Saprospiraceae bacterium]|nr:hypothetical protein [Saprospiraceae bacterium]
MALKNGMMWLILGAIIAAHAGYWFLSGHYESHSDTRNVLVIIQALVGLALMYWAVRTKPNKAV